MTEVRLVTERKGKCVRYVELIYHDLVSRGEQCDSRVAFLQLTSSGNLN